MAAPQGYCTTCRVRYRSFTLHASTEGHRAKAYRAATGKGGRGLRSSRTARRGEAARAARRSLDRYLDATMVDVRRYRRRLPLDGPAKLVDVRRHWRRQPELWGELVGYLTKAGKVAYRRVRAAA